MIRRSAVAVGFAGLLVTSSLHAQGAPPAGASPADASPPSGEVAPPPAGSAGKKSADAKEAEARFLRARQLFDEGDYALALVEFKRAYDLSPNYRVLFNIAQVDILLLDYASARLTLEKFLRDGGTDIPVARRTQVADDLAMVRQRTAHLKLETSVAADVSVDDVPIGTTPFSSPILLNAGQRKILVSRSGYLPITKVLTLAGGDTQDLVVELTPIPVEAEGPKVTTIKTKNYTPAAVGWVATGVLGLGAVVFGGLYLGKESEIRTLSDPKENVPSTRRDEVEASATRLAVAADVFGVLAIGGAAVSLYLTFRPPHTDTVTVTAAKIRITPTPTGVMGTF